MKRFLTLAVALLLTAQLIGCSLIDVGLSNDVDAFQLALIESRDRARTSNVIVETTIYMGATRLSVLANSQGSGVVVFEDDDFMYVLTNYHVTDRDGREHVDYTVRSRDDDSDIIAEMVHENEAYDLSLLRVNRSAVARDVIDIFARYDDPLRRGEMVLAIGSPRKIDGIVTYGTYKRMVDIANVDFEVILHDALIYRGSSGGALVDVSGNLVGINTWGGAETDNNGLAIPLTKVHDFLREAGIIASEEESNDSD